MPRRSPQLVDPQAVLELVQLLPDTRRRVLKYATRRARMLARAGHPVATDEASILVADAITDTLTGAVVWDRRYSLSHHLCSVIRSRTWSQLRRTGRCIHLSLDAIVEGGMTGAVESVEGNHAPTRPDTLIENAQLVAKLYRAFRERAICDASLIALLDAYVMGIVKRRDVMKLTGLSRAEFVNARRRLDRMLCSVPSELRSAALATIRGDRGISLCSSHSATAARSKGLP